MTLLISLAAVALFSYAASNLIKKYALLFYALAIVLNILYIFIRFFAEYNQLLHTVFLVVQKGQIAYAFFAVVMFIGVLGESKLRSKLIAIRAELSLLGCLFALGHAGGYLTSFFMTIFRDSVTIPLLTSVSMMLSLASFALMLILGVTTLSFVRTKMKSGTWKSIQRLAYPFFVLIHLHLMVLLVPALRPESTEILVSVVVYFAVFVLYIALRSKKAINDHARLGK